jgi:hypothetical protein
VNSELRFTCIGGESAFVACRIRQIKYVLSNTLIEILETRNYPLDMVSDAAIVSDKIFPWNRRPVAEDGAS